MNSLLTAATLLALTTPAAAWEAIPCPAGYYENLGKCILKPKFDHPEAIQCTPDGDVCGIGKYNAAARPPRYWDHPFAGTGKGWVLL